MIIQHREPNLDCVSNSHRFAYGSHIPQSKYTTHALPPPLVVLDQLRLISFTDDIINIATGWYINDAIPHSIGFIFINHSQLP